MNRQSVRALERLSEEIERPSRSYESPYRSPTTRKHLEASIQNRESGIRFHPSSLIPHPSPRRAAFTLVEMLAIIIIIAILFGIVVGAAKYAQTKAARSRAETEIAAVETALERFKSDTGDYPFSTENRGNTGTNSILLYVALATGPRPYLTFKPNQVQVSSPPSITVIVHCTTNVLLTVTNAAVIDPFGNPYDYFHNPCGPGGQTNAATFDFWSYGPDGQSNNADDVTNWKQN